MIGKRAEPYSRKARVEVTFEGEQPAKSSSTNVSAKSTQSTPAPSASGNAKQAASASAVPKNKGKGKAVSQTPQAAVEPAEPEQATSGSTFIVVAGSYEKLLYGLEGSYAPGADKPTVKPIFIFPAHLACVKAVAASPGGKWLATGSEDEFVKVWDLRRRKEVGSLSQHTGGFGRLCKVGYQAHDQDLSPRSTSRPRRISSPPRRTRPSRSSELPTGLCSNRSRDTRDGSTMLTCIPLVESPSVSERTRRSRCGTS